MISMDCSHPDIEEFIKVKTVAGASAFKRGRHTEAQKLMEASRAH